MSVADFHRPRDLILVPFFRCRCNTTYSVDRAGRDHVPPSFSGSSAFPVVCAHLRPATWESHKVGIANCVHSVHSVSLLFSFPRSIPVQLPPVHSCSATPRSFAGYANKRDYTRFDSRVRRRALVDRYSKFILYRSHLPGPVFGGRPLWQGKRTVSPIVKPIEILRGRNSEVSPSLRFRLEDFPQ